MKYIETSIPDVWVLEPRVFEDARGYFMETWREEDFNQHIGRKVHFVQDNQSLSSRGVLRGLHYQKGELSQAKLVRVLQGTVVDVFTYKVDNRYAPEAECSIRFDDPSIGIEWPINDPSEVLLSEKDLAHAVSFEAAEKF